tara:strand:+ start:2181 stop:2321 length:141 start_codon:yes stop_codon:yes gene_type:complete
MNNGMAISLLLIMVIAMVFLSTIEDEVIYEETDGRGIIYREKGLSR